MEVVPMAVSVYPQGRRTKPEPAHSFITRSGSGYRVHSPAIVNGTARLFLIENLAADTAMVTMPEVVVGPGVGPTDVPSHYIAEFQLITGAAGACTYSVVMKPEGAGLVTAQGNSDPVIIIDPPAN